MSAADVERNRLTGSAFGLLGTRQSGGSGSWPAALRCDAAQAWFRRSLLALPLALAVGGCTMVQADPVDRATIGPLSHLKTPVARPVTTEATDDAAWRLRLTRL